MPHPSIRLPLVGLLLALLVAAGGTRPRASSPQAGPYLGQRLPGAQPALFAPGLVSTGLFERDLAMTPDGHEVYWTVSSPGRLFVAIVGSRLLGGAWTVPEVLPQLRDSRWLYLEPAISPDGRRFFFTRATAGEGGGLASASIWVMERQGDGWGQPTDLGAPINVPGSNQFFPSLTRDGSLYFTRESGTAADGIYRSRLVNGRYAQPERLPAQVNAGAARFNAFVDPGERYLLVPVQGRPDTVGGIDYYVVFRNPDDTWREPVNLGEPVNTRGSGEYSPFVSPDGRYFFFMSSRVPAASRPPSLTARFFHDIADRPANGNADIYWMEAGFIEKLGR